MEKMSQQSQYTELEECVLGLVLGKLVIDWSNGGFVYSEGPEKYFEDWVDANHASFNADFERNLFGCFIKYLIAKGKCSGR